MNYCWEGTYLFEKGDTVRVISGPWEGSEETFWANQLEIVYTERQGKAV